MDKNKRRSILDADHCLEVSSAAGTWGPCGWIAHVKCHPGVLPGLEANQNQSNGVLTHIDILALRNRALIINRRASKT